MSRNGLEDGTHPLQPGGLTENATSGTASVISEISSLAAVRTALAALHSRDAIITNRLKTLSSTKADTSHELGRLDLLRAHLSAQAIHTREVSRGMLDAAAVTAAHLSSQVKKLDLEKKNVEETLRVVEQVVELKACVQGVVGSMGALQDWEAAAGYLFRAAKIPREIVDGDFAARIVPSVEIPEAPGTTLSSARESLCSLFIREFEKAATEGDGSKVTRFFKLFPLIGKEETGLEAYGRYICKGVAARARDSLREDSKGKDALFFALVLTRLFEHIAQIIEGHGSLVEIHYGKGMMVKVIEILQEEANVQGGIILDTWGDERNIDRRLRDMKSNPFSYLVQSFLSGHKNASNSKPGTPVGVGNSNIHEEEGISMKETDEILGEISMMLSRWSLYSRFLGGKCRDPHQSPEIPLQMPKLLLDSTLHQKVSNLLITSFNSMTTFFFRRSVEKAFQLDESPSGLSLNISKPIASNPPFIISAVDDIMYIVSTILQRSLSTFQRETITSVVPTISRILGSDFIGIVQRKMRDEFYPKAIVKGELPPEDKVISFIVLLNSLETSSEYITRIVNSHLKPEEPSTDHGNALKTSVKEMFLMDNDADSVTTALETLEITFTSQAMELHSDGLHVMLSQVIKPRLRPMLTEAFREIDYLLTEDEGQDIAQEEERLRSILELVAQKFEERWEAAMKPIQRIMNPNSFSTLLDQTARYLAQLLEKRVWSYAGKITALGAQRMEKIFSDIIRIVAKGGRYGLRESFSRVSQICMLANLDDEEWNAINAAEDGEESMTWFLSSLERQKARKLVGI
ncbi:unnamed protein product [Blumeria hordei]|uniref:Conserved oligomeric Golgi complex subunit 4 n=2 Tax=Blumeria hordei TaxID=2867405 RepID=A0A383UTH8_BLUHO|nr:Golgi transport complex subunit Cog4 [Blumeria hordei DH14]SZF02988.1 unnamed protein product [Blumeria hordei]